jgi:CRP-like cAMP-binding protein
MIHSLTEHPLFANLGQEVIERLRANGTVYSRRYKKGLTLHNEGSTCTSLDILTSGTLIAYSLDARGNSLIMFSFHAGDVIGANLLFADNPTYPLNIYCETECTIIHMKKISVRALLEDPSFSFTFIRYLSQITQSVNRKIFIISGKKLRERIMEYLKNESIRQRRNPVILPVSKKQMADILGVQRPSLFREIKKMKEEGLIDYSNRCITLHYSL